MPRYFLLRLISLLLLWLFAAVPGFAQAPGTLAIVAGGGSQDGEGIPALDLALSFPLGVAIDAEGNVYVADTANHRVRRVDATTGIATTVAGTGATGFSGDGGPGPEAQLQFPQGVAVDESGNIYIADAGNRRIRRVDATTGIITTIAGTGDLGGEGDGGPATEAQFGEIIALVANGNGQLYVSDGIDAQGRGNNRVRLIDLSTGAVTNVAGSGSLSFSGDGGPATDAGLTTEGIAVDAAGNIYIADFNNYRVRRVDAETGIISTVAGRGPVPFTGGGGYSGDGGDAIAAQLNVPTGVAVDEAGHLYIADTGNNRIRAVDPASGAIMTVAGTGVSGTAGDGGPAMLAQMSEPSRMVIDPNGDLLIVDTGNDRIRRLYDPTFRAAILSVPTLQVEFQQTSIGETRAQALTVENRGNLPLLIQPIDIDNPDFTVQTALPLNVAALQTAEITLLFTPQAEGLFEGQLTLTSTDPLNPTATVSLRGEGVAPDIGVFPTELIFGRTFIGTESTQTVQVSNLGAGTLIIDRAESSDPLQFYAVFPDTLRVGTAPSNVTLTFRPIREDTQRATVTLYSNDPDDPQITVDLKGLGRRAKPGGFVDLADSLGAGDAGAGFGSAWGDYDGDGDPDLYVVKSLEPNLLYRNDGARFVEVGLSAGVADDSDGSGAAWADIDGDGDLDLYVTNFGQANRLYRNDGGQFSDVAPAMGVDDLGDGYGAAWADYDRDGDPDLYVANFGVNRLYRNDGRRFSDVAPQMGLDDGSSSVQPAWADYDNDGDPDLFLANSGPNRMFRNDGGTFTDITQEVGLSEQGLGGASFGAAWGDFNNDGFLDLYVPYFRQENRLYINLAIGTDGSRRFAPGLLSARQHGVADSSTSRSRGAVWADFDNDGDLDLYVANSGQPNRFFRNQGATFVEQADTMGVQVGLDSRGVALADFDGDGGVDLFVVAQNGPDRLYRNQEANGDWLRVVPASTNSSSDAIGTRVEIVFSGGRRAVREIAGGSSYLSQDALTASFGVDDASAVDTLTIRWPLGIIQRFFNVPINQPFKITEVAPLPPATILLEPVTSTLVANGIAQTDVLASLLNADGEVVLLSDVSLNFSVIGDAILVGNSVVLARDGRASVTVRVGQTPGQLAIIVRAQGLSDGRAVLDLLAPIGNEQATIRTVAGSGAEGDFGDGGLATEASLDAPRDVAVDSLGNVYISDTQNHRLRRVVSDSTIETVVGDGVQSSTGDDLPASQAQVATPQGLAFLPSRDLLVVDQGGQRVRRIQDGTDTIRAFAGRGISGFGGDGKDALQANMSVPTGIATDGLGNVWIADQFNNRIRRVDADGIITTFAGSNRAGSAGDGGEATKAELSRPLGVAVDSLGRVFIADTGNNRIRMVDEEGIISTIAGTGDAGELGDGGPALMAELNGPRDVAVGRDGRLYIADTDNHTVRMVDLAARNIQTVAGTGFRTLNRKEGSAFEVDLNQPSGLFVGPTGTILIADTGNNRIRELTVDYTKPSTPTLPAEDAVADFNQDGKIDFIDFLLFAGAYGGTAAEFDMDSDGIVGFGDFLTFVQIFERNMASDLSASRTGWR